MRRPLPALLAAGLVAFGPRGTSAQTPDAPLQVLVTDSGSRWSVTFDVTAAFTERFRRRLANGLGSRVLIRMSWLAPDGTLDEHVRQCEMRRDVWDDVTRVRIVDAERELTRTTPLLDEALQTCGRIQALPLVDRAAVDPNLLHRLQVEVALNPVSEELVERARQFMSNPRGGERRTFFGYVARLFRSREAGLGEAFTFLSGPLQLPRVR